jgi:hypothetical protein
MDILVYIMVNFDFISILLQLLFFVTSISQATNFIKEIPMWIHVVACSQICLLIPVQELVKSHDRNHWIRFQRRTRLEFNTKLGMHSPL